MSATRQATPTEEPSRGQRLESWVLASPVNASIAGALGYVVAQPLLLPFVYVGTDTPGFASASMWVRFELTELCLGCLVGTLVYHSRQWRRQSWVRDWAEAAIPAFALGAANLARRLPRTSTDQWIAMVLVSGAVTGVVIALGNRGLRRVFRGAGGKALESDTDARIG